MDGALYFPLNVLFQKTSFVLGLLGYSAFLYRSIRDWIFHSTCRVVMDSAHLKVKFPVTSRPSPCSVAGKGPAFD
ncbi:MAG: hypothetical protein EBX52_12130 [Proteobacteria bacterium]|nr:hypothetical protein [Pseudomonadota bacterium]